MAGGGGGCYYHTISNCANSIGGNGGTPTGGNGTGGCPNFVAGTGGSLTTSTVGTHGKSVTYGGGGGGGYYGGTEGKWSGGGGGGSHVIDAISNYIESVANTTWSIHSANQHGYISIEVLYPYMFTGTVQHYTVPSDVAGLIITIAG